MTKKQIKAIHVKVTKTALSISV